MAPLTGGHYRPNNVSNPYNSYPHQQTQFAAHSNYNGQNFSGHPSFPTSQQTQHINIFGGGGLSNGPQGSGFGTTALQGAGGTGLASQEAQMRFAHGAALQRLDETGSHRGGSTSSRIREVWANNMEQEFSIIRNLVDKYPFISMDTEFPGIVARPMGNFPSKADYHYQTLRCNVDLLKLIQLGITLWSPEGELPSEQLEAPLDRHDYPNKLVMCPCTWTFNFKFSLDDDMSSADSIVMLKKAGVDFDKCAQIGISPAAFGARLIDSGLVLQENVTWLSFHSGYDFGYLVKLMFPSLMPENDEKYLEFVKIWFRKIYDIKYLLRSAQRKQSMGTLNQQASDIILALGQKSGLQDLANELGCKRQGSMHTAGSDAWLTGAVFWAMRSKIFDNDVPGELVNKIWGLNGTGVGPPASAASQAAAMQNQTPNQNGASFHTTFTPSTYRTDPSTPQNAHTGLASSTPGQNQGQNQGFTGSMGMGGGGAFNFIDQYSPQRRISHEWNVFAPDYINGMPSSMPTHTQPGHNPQAMDLSDNVRLQPVPSYLRSRHNSPMKIFEDNGNGPVDDGGPSFVPPPHFLLPHPYKQSGPHNGLGSGLARASGPSASTKRHEHLR